MMRREHVVLIGLASLTLGACGIGIQGSGRHLVETRNLDTFTRIDAGGRGELAVTVDARVGDTVAIEVEGDDNIVALVSTAVVDGELVIRVETERPIYDTIPLRLRVTAPALTHLRSSDSIDVRVAGLTGDALVVESSDSSDVTLAGELAWLELHGSGSADMFARQLRATDAIVTATDTSDIEVCATGVLAIEASGSSDVTYFCSPTRIERHVSGSADVTGQ